MKVELVGQQVAPVTLGDGILGSSSTAFASKLVEVRSVAALR